MISPAGAQSADGDHLLTLPTAHRDAFKQPMGPVYTAPEPLLETVTGPVITVGDIVTHTLTKAGHRPQIAVVDGLTKRAAVDPSVKTTIAQRPNHRTVTNPAGTVTAELLETLRTVLGGDRVSTIDVDGEEDLAAVPAVIGAEHSSTIVYGQPDEGMVAVEATPERKGQCRELLELFEGAHEQALAYLE